MQRRPPPLEDQSGVRSCCRYEALPDQSARRHCHQTVDVVVLRICGTHSDQWVALETLSDYVRHHHRRPCGCDCDSCFDFDFGSRIENVMNGSGKRKNESGGKRVEIGSGRVLVVVLVAAAAAEETLTSDRDRRAVGHHQIWVAC